MFLSILMIILTTNEYTYKTNRQNVIDGWSRLSFYHAKVLLVFIISAIATAYMFLLGFIFGAINSGSVANVFSEIHQVGYFFLLSLNYLGFALFLSIWIKRSGLAIGLFLLYSFIIENIAKSIINHWVDLPLGNLMPLQTSDELLPFPLMQMAKTMMGNGATISMNVYAVVTVLWCLIYYYGGKMILVKRDW
jgi:ABC-2 type transport system permease protein